MDKEHVSKRIIRYFAIASMLLNLGLALSPSTAQAAPTPQPIPGLIPETTSLAERQGLGNFHELQPYHFNGMSLLDVDPDRGSADIAWHNDFGAVVRVETVGPAAVQVHMAQLAGTKQQEGTGSQANGLILYDRVLTTGTKAAVWVNPNPVGALCRTSSIKCEGPGIEALVETHHGGYRDTRVTVVRDGKPTHTYMLGDRFLDTVVSIGSDKMVAVTTPAVGTPESPPLKRLSLWEPYTGRSVSIDLSQFPGIDQNDADLDVTTLRDNRGDDSLLVVFDKTTKKIYYAQVDDFGTVTVVRTSTVNLPLDALKSAGSSMGALSYNSTARGFLLLGIHLDGASFVSEPSFITDLTVEDNPQLLGATTGNKPGTMVYYLKANDPNKSNMSVIWAITHDAQGRVIKTRVGGIARGILNGGEEGQDIVPNITGEGKPDALVVRTSGSSLRVMDDFPFQMYLPIAQKGSGVAIDPDPRGVVPAENQDQLPVSVSDGEL